jgi:hypothetical protein
MTFIRAGHPRKRRDFSRGVDRRIRWRMTPAGGIRDAGRSAERQRDLAEDDVYDGGAGRGPAEMPSPT